MTIQNDDKIQGISDGTLAKLIKSIPDAKKREMVAVAVAQLTPEQRLRYFVSRPKVMDGITLKLVKAFVALLLLPSLCFAECPPNTEGCPGNCCIETDE